MVNSIFGFAPVLFWLILAVALAIFEIVTLGLTTIWFALGAFFAFLAALCNASIPFQIVIFIIVSILSLLLVRPLSVKYFNNRITKTNIDALIGKRVQVTKDIDNIKEQGNVALEGAIWNARSVNENEIISKGEIVVIQRVEGNKLFVTKDVQ